MSPVINIINNHIQSLGKEWGTFIGKKYGKYNIKFARTKEAVAKQAQSSSTPIIQLSMNNEIIRFWNSMNDAKRAGYHAGHISNCCN